MLSGSSRRRSGRVRAAARSVTYMSRRREVRGRMLMRCLQGAAGMYKLRMPRGFNLMSTA